MNGRIFGYARVSSKNQHLDRQLESLKKYVAEDNILTDKASGKDLNRPAYQALKGALGLRKGDTLIITSLDRLSRNKDNIRHRPDLCAVRSPSDVPWSSCDDGRETSCRIGRCGDGVCRSWSCPASRRKFRWYRHHCNDDQQILACISGKSVSCH